MNAKSTSPNPRVESESAIHTELTESFRLVESQVEPVMRKAGHLPPTLWVRGSAGLFRFAPGALHEEAEENNFAALARLICAAHDARLAVLAIETWIVEALPGEPLVPNLRPAESPRRKDYIFLMGEARGGVPHHVMLPILRDRRGRFSCFGVNRKESQHRAEGRFANLLPPSPVTEEVRLFAAALSAQRGLAAMRISVPSGQSTAFSA